MYVQKYFMHTYMTTPNVHTHALTYDTQYRQAHTRAHAHALTTCTRVHPCHTYHTPTPHIPHTTHHTPALHIPTHPHTPDVHAEAQHAHTPRTKQAEMLPVSTELDRDAESDWLVSSVWDNMPVYPIKQRWFLTVMAPEIHFFVQVGESWISKFESISCV